LEDAIFCLVNGGVQNTMQSSLVRALLGAHVVGLLGIPQRFLDGLEDHKHTFDLAQQIAKALLEHGHSALEDVWKVPEHENVKSLI
jgi:hypothetical protein